MARLKVSKPDPNLPDNPEPTLPFPRTEMHHGTGARAAVFVPSSPDYPLNNNSTPHGNGDRALTAFQPGDGAAPGTLTDRSAELAQKIRDLVRLAHEQGYLTYTDITET